MLTPEETAIIQEIKRLQVEISRLLFRLDSAAAYREPPGIWGGPAGGGNVDELPPPEVDTSAPLCKRCGAMMQRNGTCWLCPRCGEGGGCGG